MTQDSTATLARLREEPGNAELFRAVVRTLRDSGATADVVEAYSLRAKAATATESVRLWCALAELAPRGTSERRAALMEAFTRAAELDTALSTLDHHFAATEDADASGTLLLWRMEASPDVTTRLAAARRVVQAAEARDDYDLAVRGWTCIGRLAPSELGAAVEQLQMLRALGASADMIDAAVEAMIRDSGDRHALLRLLDDRIQALPESETDKLLALCLEIAPLGFEVTGDPAIPMEYLRYALGRAPGGASAIAEAADALRSGFGGPNADLIALLRQVAELEERWADVVRLCDEESALRTETEARETLDLHAAEIAANRVGDAEDAVRRFGEAAARNPRVARASAEAVRRLAEREAAPEARTRFTQRAHEILYRAGDWEAIYGILREAADSAHDPAAHGERLLEVAEFELSELKRPSQAVLTFVEAVPASSSREAVDRAVRGLREAAQHADSRTTAFDALATVFETHGRWAELAELLSSEVDYIAAPEDRARRCIEIGEIFATRMEQPAEALPWFEQAYGEARAQASLERAITCARAAKRSADLARLLGVLASVVSDPAAREHLEADRALILAKELGDLPSALETLFASDPWPAPDSPRGETLRGVVAALPDAVAALMPIVDAWAEEDAARAAGLSREAVDILGLENEPGRQLELRALALAPPNDERLLRLRAAVDSGAGADARIAVYSELIGRDLPDPTLRGARNTLASLLREQGHDDEAIDLAAGTADRWPTERSAYDILLPLLESRERWTDLAEFVELGIEALELDPAERIDWRDRLMGLLADRLGRPDLAMGIAARILTGEPLHGRALEFARSHTMQSEEWDILYRALAPTVDLLSSDELRDERALEVAEIADQRMGDPELAAPWHARVARSGTLAREARLAAYSALLERAREGGDGATWAALLGERLELLADPIEQADDLRAHFRNLPDPPPAEMAGALAKAVAAHPSAPVDLVELAALAAEFAGDPETAMRALSRRYEADRAGMPAEAIARYAQLLLGRDDRRADGWKVLSESLGSAPDEEVLLSVARDSVRDDSEALALATSLAERALRAADPPLTASSRIALLRRAAERVSERPALASDAERWQRAILGIEPTDTAAFEAVAERLEGREDREGLREHYRTRIAATESLEKRVELLRELATLCEATEAEKVQRTVIELIPGDVEARLALSELYRAAERHADLATVLAELAEVDPDAAARTRFRHALGQLLATRLHDVPAAIAVYEKSVEEDPLDEKSLQHLEGHYRDLSNWDGVASTLERMGALEAEDERRVSLWKEAATVHERDRHDLGDAVALLERVLEVEPGNLTVIEEIARLYEAQERWEEHLGALERLAAAAPFRELQAEAMLHAARVMHDRLDRSRDAFDLGVRALDHAEATDAALGLLRAAAEKCEVWTPWANLLRRVGQVEKGAARKEALELELARVLDERLESGEHAIGVLLESFLRQPRVGPVLDLAEEIAGRRNIRGKLLDAYRALNGDEKASTEMRWRGLHGSMQFAELEAQRLEVAFDLMERAAEIPELAERAEKELERLSSEHGMWDRFTSWLDAKWESSDGGDELSLLLRKAMVQEKQLGDWNQAFETLIGAYQTAPFEARVQEPLFRLAREHDSWNFVFKVLELLQAESPEDERLALRVEMSRLYEVELGNAAEAFQQQLRAFELRSRDTGVRERLEALARAADLRGELLDAWEWEVARHDLRQEKREALKRVTALASELGEWPRAANAWAQMLEAAPEDESPLAECETALAEAGRRDLLVGVLSRWIAAMRQRAMRARWMVYLAKVAEETGVLERAREAYEEALKSGAEEGPTRRALIEVLHRLAAWEPLARQLELEVARTEDTERRIEIWLELRRIYLEELGEAQKATDTLLRAERAMPAEERLFDAIVDHYTALERWDDLVEFLVTRAQRGTDAARKKRLLLQAAEIATEHQDDARRALRLADLVAKEHPADIEVLDLRARTLAALGRWADHIEALSRLAEHSEPRAAVAALEQAAEAAAAQLMQPGRAMELYRKAAQLDASSGTPWLGIAAIHAAAGRESEELAALHEAVARLEGNPSGGADLARACVTLGLRLEAQRGSAEQVLEWFEKAVAADPSSREATEGYQRRLERAGGTDRLLSQLDSEIEGAPSDGERARLLVRKASILFYEAKRASDAEDALDRSLALAGTYKAALALRGDFDLAAGRWDSARTVYQLLLGDTGTLDPESLLKPRPILPGERGDGDVSAVYLTRSGHAAERCGDVDGAFDLYMAANAEDDTWQPALAALARISLAREHTAAAERYAGALLRSPGEAPSQMLADMHAVCAQAAEGDGRNEEALGSWDAAAAQPGPHRRDAAERAVALAVRTEPPLRAATRLEALAELVEDASERAQVYRRLGELLGGVPGAGEQAARAFQQALELAPDDPRNAELLIEQLLRVGAPDDGLRLIEPQIAGAATPDRRSALLMARGDLHRAAGHAEAALSDWAEALELRPHSATALDRVVAAYRANGDLAGLAAQLELHLLRVPASATGPRAQVLRALGGLLLDELDMVVEARKVFEELRSNFPNDVRVLHSLLRVYEHEGIQEDDLALGVASDLVRLGELSADLLASLETLHYRADNLDGVLHALLVRRLAGVANEEESALLDGLPSTPPSPGAGEMRDRIYETWLRPRALAPWVALRIGTAAERAIAVGAVAEPEAGADLAPESAAGRVLATLATAFGVDGITARVVEGQDRGARSAATVPPSLLISPAVAAETDEAALRFELGRALLLSRPEYRLLDSLGAFDFMGFLEAALDGAVSSRVELDEALASQLGQWKARLGDFDSGLDARRVERRELPSAGSYREVAAAAAIRSGILCSFQTMTAFERVRTELGEARPTSVDELRGLCERHPTIRALVTFALSDDYLQARRSLGLVLGAPGTAP